MFRSTILFIFATFGVASAFSNAFIGSTRVAHRRSAFASPRSLSMKVVDIDSEAAFDSTVSGAGSNLVIVDYSTTWCGPCKVIAPKFDELSDKYPDAVFLKVSSHLLIFVILSFISGQLILSNRFFLLASYIFSGNWWCYTSCFTIDETWRSTFCPIFSLF